MSSGTNHDRLMKQFARVSELLEQFAMEAGGTYDPRAQLTAEEIEAANSPFITFVLENMLLSTRRSPDERERNLQQELDTIRFGRAEAIVPHGNFKLRFILRAIPLLIHPDNDQCVPSLNIVCPLTPRTGANLFLNRADSQFYGPTGLALNQAWPMFAPNDQFGRFFLSGKLRRLIQSWPANTYFCPFENNGLKKRYSLRSTSVSLGQAFASCDEIVECLEAITGLEYLYTSKLGLLFGEEYAIVVSAQAGQDINQLKNIDHLVTAVVELLQEQNAITRE